MNHDLYPRLAYEDDQAAVEWLTRVFGFKEATRKENLLWLELGGNVVMVSRAAFGLKSPRQRRRSLSIFPAVERG